MTKHFVRFFSPGTLVAESSDVPIDSWDVEAARVMSGSVEERHGAVPYGFMFLTRTRGPKDLDSKISKKSKMYYINCKKETLAEIEARALPSERILLENMRGNGWDAVVTTTRGWKWTQPLCKGDKVLD